MKIITCNEKLKTCNIAGIILKPNSPEIKNDFFKIKTYFQEYGIDIILEKNSAKMIGEDGFSLKELCQESDFLISLGGDGTLLSVVRKTYMYKKAILGIHLGTLGFLTDIIFDDVLSFVENFKKDLYTIDNRMLIEALVGNKTCIAFNDIVISRKSISSMIKINAKIDNIPFNSYYGDGIILSTPAGSTAYNLSVGGPIVYPLTEAFILTPIASHSLRQRPLVLPANFEIEFTILDKQGAVLIIDGQDTYEIKQNSSVKIKISSHKVKLIHREERNFFKILNQKLGWGN